MLYILDLNTKPKYKLLRSSWSQLPTQLDERIPCRGYIKTGKENLITPWGSCSSQVCKIWSAGSQLIWYIYRSSAALSLESSPCTLFPKCFAIFWKDLILKRLGQGQWPCVMKWLCVSDPDSWATGMDDPEKLHFFRGRGYVKFYSSAVSLLL